MTNEEALESLEFEILEECHCGHIEIELIVAISALKKQIPMKVKEKQVVEDVVFYNLDFLCPSCENAVIGQPYEPDYCKHCGQALKWEE